LLIVQETATIANCPRERQSISSSWAVQIYVSASEPKSDMTLMSSKSGTTAVKGEYRMVKNCGSPVRGHGMAGRKLGAVAMYTRRKTRRASPATLFFLAHWAGLPATSMPHTSSTGSPSSSLTSSSITLSSSFSRKSHLTSDFS